MNLYCDLIEKEGGGKMSESLENADFSALFVSQ